MPQEATSQVSEKDYLEGEITSDIRHEYVNGYIYAMSWASENHNRIAGNFHAKFHNHLDDHELCEPFVGDMKAKVVSGYRYPDVMVWCKNDDDTDIYTKKNPIILIEVLSKSTRKTDTEDKKLEYINIASLQEYVMIEQDTVQVIVLRRKDNWFPRFYYLGDSVTFESIGMTISVEDIYKRVENEEMIEFRNLR